MGGQGRSILLSGMMGSGKSAVGRRLAERLGWRFIDTDEEVASVTGMSVGEIFATLGEDHFRVLEREAVRQLPEKGAVVALGGGAVVDPENRALLAAKGSLVFLEADPQTLARRIGEAAERPLLAGTSGDDRLERLRQLLAVRIEAYASADLRIRTDERTVEEVCDAILRGLAREESA